MIVSIKIRKKSSVVKKNWYFQTPEAKKNCLLDIIIELILMENAIHGRLITNIFYPLCITMLISKNSLLMLLIS